MNVIGNIVRCLDCRVILIAEEVKFHKCQPKPFQWFFEGDWLWGTEDSGWLGINTKTLDMKRLSDITRRFNNTTDGYASYRLCISWRGLG